MVVVVALALAAACRQQSAQPAVTAAPHVPEVPVGPLPGLPQDRQEPQNPFAGNADAILEGRRFFLQYNCAGCHGDHGGGGMGPSLRDERWLYGSSDARIARSIVDGRAHGMPAWREMLTPAQVWQITAYITSMRTPHEADPPPGG